MYIRYGGESRKQFTTFGQSTSQVTKSLKSTGCNYIELLSNTVLLGTYFLYVTGEATSRYFTICGMSRYGFDNDETIIFS